MAKISGACGTCGLTGGEHYAICPESPDYYSPERERADAEWSEFFPDQPQGEVDFEIQGADDPMVAPNAKG